MSVGSGDAVVTLPCTSAGYKQCSMNEDYFPGCDDSTATGSIAAANSANSTLPESRRSSSLASNSPASPFRLTFLVKGGTTLSAVFVP